MKSEHKILKTNLIRGFWRTHYLERIIRVPHYVLENKKLKKELDKGETNKVTDITLENTEPIKAPAMAEVSKHFKATKRYSRFEAWAISKVGEADYKNYLLQLRNNNTSPKGNTEAKRANATRNKLKRWADKPRINK